MRITDFPELIAPTGNDLLVIVDIANDLTKKVKLDNLPISLPALTALATKQNTLVSGVTIKTVNSQSLLGAGDIPIPIVNPSGVSGAIQFSNGSAFASDAANLFWDDTNNRLGIGTNVPTNKLHIITDNATSPYEYSSQISQIAGSQIEGLFSAYSSTNGGYLSAGQPGISWKPLTYLSGEHRFSLAGTIGMTIHTNGNTTIGNGTTTLSARLGIRGSGSTSATTSLLVQNSAGAASLQVTDDGSVYNLGKGSISTNTVFGRASFGANITGSENVAIGFDVLSANTSGLLNTAVGNSSLKTNTNGIENVAVGVFALGNNTGGNANVAVGRSALGGNLTGSHNCAIGFDTQTGNFSSSVILGRSATATASNQFVVGSTAHNAGAVNSTTDVPATFLWSVRINGTNYKILMTT